MPEEWEIPDDELNEMLRDILHPETMSLDQAMRSKDPLASINQNLSGRTKAQKEFRLLYAAILEVNSVGVSVVFDRFNRSQVATIRAAFGRLGARKLCAALDAVQACVEQHLGRAPARANVRTLLDRSPAAIAAIDRRSAGIVAEMERMLLRHVRANLEALKG